jgi:hypothetical protein
MILIINHFGTENAEKRRIKYDTVQSIESIGKSIIVRMYDGGMLKITGWRYRPQNAGNRGIEGVKIMTLDRGGRIEVM